MTKSEHSIETLEELRILSERSSYYSSVYKLANELRIGAGLSQGQSMRLASFLVVSWPKGLQLRQQEHAAMQRGLDELARMAKNLRRLARRAIKLIKSPNASKRAEELRDLETRISEALRGLSSIVDPKTGYSLPVHGCLHLGLDGDFLLEARTGSKSSEDRYLDVLWADQVDPAHEKDPAIRLRMLELIAERAGKFRARPVGRPRKEAELSWMNEIFDLYERLTGKAASRNNTQLGKILTTTICVLGPVDASFESGLSERGAERRAGA